MARHRPKALCPYRTLVGVLLLCILVAFLLGRPTLTASVAEVVPAVPAVPSQESNSDLQSTAAPEALSVQATTVEPTRAPDRSQYGFYLHVHGHPAAVIHQVREVKKWFPGSPIHVMSDGNMDFGALCALENCSFVLCPPANDRWHPWPFLRRLYDAAVILKSEFVILLEPDNTIHGRIKATPEFDAGGLRVKERSFAGAEYVQNLARERQPGFKWTRENQEAGLCGGSYYRSAAVLDAFSDENVAKIDWNMLGEKFSKEIYSSDFAMQFALAARGYTIMPWNESAQMHQDKEIPLSGPKDAAFRHYSGPVGKPTYELKLQKEDSKLAKERPAKYQGKDPNCQVCYSFQRYVQLWGSPKCTNSLPFEYSDLMLKRYHPNLAKEPCHPDIGSLCEPHKLHPRYAVNEVDTTPAAAAEVPGSGRKLYGFYLHVFHSPAAVFYQVRKLKEVFPGSPIYVMSDGGADFSPFCEQEGCTFKMCPPANDRWHPWPFFRRLYVAAVSLNTEFVIMIHGPIKHRPKYDAGGLLVRDRSFAGADYAPRRVLTEGRWTKKNQQEKPGLVPSIFGDGRSTRHIGLVGNAGLCGGSYYKREAILDALSDERMAQLDWTLGDGPGDGVTEVPNVAIVVQLVQAAMDAMDPRNFLGERFTKEIYSSDFALQYALAARGWTIMPWKEAAQMHDNKEIPLAGPKDAAFRHYSGPVGKPTYEMKLRKEDVRLVKDQPAGRNSGEKIPIASDLDRTSGRGAVVAWPIFTCVTGLLGEGVPLTAGLITFLRSPTAFPLCYNLTRYVEIYGSSDCTSEVPLLGAELELGGPERFTYSGLLLERYHPELKSRMCDLPWLCEPGTMLSFGPSKPRIRLTPHPQQLGLTRALSCNEGPRAFGKRDNSVGLKWERGSEDEEEERADLARYGKNWQKVRRAVEAGFALKDLLQDVRESQTNSLYDRDWNRPQFGGSIKLMGPRMPTQFLGSPLLGSQRLAHTAGDSPLRGAAKSQKLRVHAKSQKVTKFNMDMEDDNEGSAPLPRGPVGGPKAGNAGPSNPTTYTMDDDDAVKASAPLPRKGGPKAGNAGAGNPTTYTMDDDDAVKASAPLPRKGGPKAGNAGAGNPTTYTMDDDDAVKASAPLPRKGGASAGKGHLFLAGFKLYNSI
ncbi:unnamed protein product [Cladocopium goreaui]|uniref:Peptidyl-prolyl cis-trans isomerase A n=1 Tax=Cladocopium goreaui TaxID=2562237 RepID=A0A9P1FYM6_9DINO|nr:unnamed protein product [Cladocopium goreaui]